MKQEFDAVIIGSGIGGLICGSVLAKNCFKTLIVEQHTAVGGFVTSYKRENFLFDVVHVLGGLKENEPLDQLFSYLEVDRKIEFIKLEKIFEFIYPDLMINCYVEIDRYKRELIKNFKIEEKNIENYFEILQRIWREVQRSYYMPNLIQYLSYPIRFPNLFKYRNMSYQEFLNIFFKDEKLKEILSSGWKYVGLNNSRISALYYICMQMSFHTGGAWYPRGGFQKLSDALADCFKNFGGTLLTNSKVKKILINKNIAEGIMLENGQTIKANYVISNADTKTTFLELIEASKLKNNFSKTIRNLKQSPSSFVVHLGLNMDIPERFDCGGIMFFPKYGLSENIFKMYDSDKIELNPKEICLGLSIPTLRDQGLAPPGHHIVDIIYSPAPYGFNENWQSGSKEEYNKLKEEVSVNIIRSAELLIPDISKHIVFKDISTPLTYERYTSAFQGGWYDIACFPKQSLLRRLPPKTPVKNLLLTGAKTFPGPGIFGAAHAGLYTADLLLDKRLTGGRLRFKKN